MTPTHGVQFMVNFVSVMISLVPKAKMVFYALDTEGAAAEIVNVIRVGQEKSVIVL